tara:strand:+ start:1336 stop:1572 length:237 start_codon:yes stop_codon:yes gene_type:complete
MSENYKLMDTILTLKGITGKGKNRIREHGTEWRIIDGRESELGIMVQSLKDKDLRWIRENVDFEIVDRKFVSQHEYKL